MKAKHVTAAEEFYAALPLIKKTFLFSGASSTELPGYLFSTLICIYTGGRKKMSAISDITGASKPLVTQQVDKLVELGYLERFHSSDDRRIIEVDLTEKGRQLSKQIVLEYRTKASQALSLLSEKDLDSFIKSIKTIKEILAKTDIR
jgi:DNA-binding MarR family transcriptional regulator